MARWHSTSCSRPEIIVLAGVPRCSACNSQPDIEQLVAQQASTIKPWVAPPDEPPEERNYFWPPCVPYQLEESTTGCASTTDEAVIESTAASKSNKTQENEPTSLPPYDRRLQNDEFRLICVYPVEGTGGDSPVHVELRTFRNDDCPEYETVSYAWGGEDDDSSAKYLVYIGDYWDVLLQTKNCRDLLRFLHPKYGVRFVWIDALCINQTDATERSSQVAKMGLIYWRCWRTVVFLGQDVAQVDTSTTFPTRKDLAAIEPESFEQILGLRYFQRVWVIQELLLAPSAIVTIGGVQYTANALTGTRMRLHWEDMAAAWVQFICNSSRFSEMNMFEVLEVTESSQASDPRDRIFGIIGFLGSGPGPKILPNYSISSLHVEVGIFGYLILNLRRIEVLLASRGYTSPPDHPTWLPHRASPKVFKEISHWMSEYEPFESTKAIESTWYSHGVSLGSKNLGLSLCVLHLFTIDAEPLSTTMIDDDRQFLRIGDYKFQISGAPVDLPGLIKRGQTDVAMIASPMLILFLEQSCRGAHKLLAAFRCLRFIREGGTGEELIYPSRAPLFHSVHDALSSACQQFDGFLHFITLYDLHDRTFGMFDRLSPDNKWSARALLQVWEAVIECWRGVRRRDYPYDIYVLSPLRESVPELRPNLIRDSNNSAFMTFWIKDTDSNRVLRAPKDRLWPVSKRAPLAPVPLVWPHPWEVLNDLDPSGSWSYDGSGAVLKFNYIDFFRRLGSDPDFEKTRDLLRVSRATGEEKCALLSRGPTTKDHFINSREWPDAQTSQPLIQAHLRKVTIL